MIENRMDEAVVDTGARTEQRPNKIHVRTTIQLLNEDESIHL